MRVIVPLPFDVACREHGRNLRVIHLLTELSRRCEIACAAGSESIAAGVTRVLPQVEVIRASDGLTKRERPASAPGPAGLRRAIRFFGFDPMLHAAVKRLGRRADVVLGFDLVSAAYLTGLNRPGHRGPVTVCDLIDDPWLTYRSGRLGEQLSLTGLKTAIAVQVLRRWLLPRIDTLVAVAPGDARRLSRATGRAVHVVPNGVAIPDEPASPAERENLVVFTGAMSFAPNEQAACFLVRMIWPRVRRMVPDARLALVGADPGRCVSELATEPGVTVTGRVPDLRAWLRRARVAAAPMLSGTGIKNKILEAAAQACPVVATRRAASGIACGPDEGILIADDPAAFAGHVVQCLRDAKSAERIGGAGAAMVRERFSWPKAADGLWAVLHAARHPNGRTTDLHHLFDPNRVAQARAPSLGKEVSIHAAT